MEYDSKQIIQLLDANTIGALFRLYGIKYDSVAFRLRVTKQSIVYRQKMDSWKPWERELVYEILKQHGCDSTLITIVNLMMQNQKKQQKKDVK